MVSRWMLCPAAREKAEREGIVVRCEGRANHICNGPRTPHTWTARDGKGNTWESEQPHCGSCEADQEHDGPYGLYDDIACCCVHDEEAKRMATDSGTDSGTGGGA